MPAHFVHHLFAGEAGQHGLRLDQTGGDGVDANVVASQIERHRPCESFDGAFAGAVDGSCGHGQPRQDGADVDDASPAALGHFPGHELAQVVDPAHVDVPDPVEFLDGHIQEVRPAEPGGIVDQHCHRPCSLRSLGQLAAVLHVADVRLHKGAGAARRHDRCQRLLGLGHTAVVVHDHVGALAGKSDGRCLADALRRAGDDHNLVCETPVHGLCLTRIRDQA